MKPNFERGALVLVGTLVSGLIGAVYLNPPDAETASPRAVLRLAASAVVPQMKGPHAAPVIAVEAQPAATGSLTNTFRRIGYDYDALFSEGAPVPRLFLASVPSDLDKVRRAEERKALFVQTVLPLILQANEQLRADRRRVLDLREQVRAGHNKLDAIDRLWLAMMTKRYGVARDDLDGLVARVDIVPTSLALAQAAAESGWGTSRFVREGNALFGQWTSSDHAEGLVPMERDEGKSHKVKAFDSLYDSVRAYMLNLNTHRAYRGFRKARAAARMNKRPLDGHNLAGQLIAYSERGLDYVATLRTIMAANELERLDDIRLRDGAPVTVTATGKILQTADNGA